MASFKIFIKESAQRELEQLGKKDRRLVEQRITALAHDPRPNGCKPLQGKQFVGLFRIRAGNFRIIYQIQDERPVVLVIKIGNRREVYD
ncbi:MAG: type II toxin-antitoxin system RelE/ParE family toxin [Solirubrobacterales bacterium]|nr:type II toxin-antitoxin system RelE/ParE family toxin [Solirubrobacterales bacterium]